MKGFLFSQIPTVFICLYIALLYFGFGYQFQNFSDSPGHISQAISTLYNLDKSIYNFKALLGYFPILYPPFTFLLYEILKNIFPPALTWVYIFFLTLPFFTFGLYKICTFFKTNYTIFFILSFFCLTTSFEHESMMIFTGSNPAFVGITGYIWTVYLFLSQGITKRNIPIYSLLLSIVIMSHTISASAIGIMFALIGSWLIKDRQFKLLIYITLIWLITIIASIVWIIPFIEFNYEVVRNNMAGYSDNTYIFIFLLISSLLIFKSKLLSNNILHSQRIRIIGITSIILIGMAMLPEFPGLNGMHMYRYFIYGLLIIIPLIFWESSSRFTKSKLILYALPIFFALSILLNNNRTTQYVEFKVLPTDFQPTGRVMDLTTPESNHTFYSNLIGKYPISSLDGLYKQNAPSLTIGSTIKQNYIEFTSKAESEYTKQEYEKIFNKISAELDLMGINYFIVPEKQLTASQIQTLKKENRIFEFATSGLKKDNQILSSEIIYLVKRKNQTDIVEILNFLPEIKTTDSITKLDINNLSIPQIYSYNKELQEYYSKVDLEKINSKTQLSSIRVESDSLTFKIDTAENKQLVPILIKTSFSKYLQARNWDTGQELKLFDVSPNFILLFSEQGNISIYPEAPQHYRILWYISIFTFAVLIILSIYLIFVDRSSKMK